MCNGANAGYYMCNKLVTVSARDWACTGLGVYLAWEWVCGHVTGTELGVWARNWDWACVTWDWVCNMGLGM